MAATIVICSVAFGDITFIFPLANFKQNETRLQTFFHLTYFRIHYINIDVFEQKDWTLRERGPFVDHK